MPAQREQRQAVQMLENLLEQQQNEQDDAGQVKDAVGADNDVRPTGCFVM